jgi:uncharacterized lipoprotein YbaY
MSRYSEASFGFSVGASRRRLLSIDPRMSYRVRAVIRRDGWLLFTSDTHNPVLTRGADASIDMRLVAAGPGRYSAAKKSIAPSA